MKTKISLGGQNNHGRMSGARSSRASSTIFKSLQKLDREIAELRNKLDPFALLYLDFKKHHNKKIREKIEKLDTKRREVRLERKKYKHNTKNEN